MYFSEGNIGPMLFKNNQTKNEQKQDFNPVWWIDFLIMEMFYIYAVQYGSHM
jgi:hypothetical protein